jgi:hypothetical protein
MNTDFISMELPFAAGSLCSTVGDRRASPHPSRRWHQRVHLLAYYPDDSLTVVVLSNTAPAPSNEVTDAIARVALGIPPVGPPPRPVDLPIPPDEVARLVGSYRVTFPDGSRRPARITASEGRLMFQLDNQPGVRLMKQAAPNTYAVAGQPAASRWTW